MMAKPTQDKFETNIDPATVERLERKLTAKINLKRVSRIIVYEDFQSAHTPAGEKTPLRECLEHDVCYPRAAEPDQCGVGSPLGLDVDQTRPTSARV